MHKNLFAAIATGLVLLMPGLAAAETGDESLTSSPARHHWATSVGSFYLQGYANWQHETFIDSPDPKTAPFKAFALAGTRVGFISASDRWEISLWSRSRVDEADDKAVVDMFAPGSLHSSMTAVPSHGFTVTYRIN